MNQNDITTLRYIAGNIEQDQREHSARKLRDIADRIEALLAVQPPPKPLAGAQAMAECKHGVPYRYACEICDDTGTTFGKVCECGSTK